MICYISSIHKFKLQETLKIVALILFALLASCNQKIDPYDHLASIITNPLGLILIFLYPVLLLKDKMLYHYPK